MTELSEVAQKRRALDLLLSAWDEALEAGVHPELLASTAIFAAFTDMVDLHGEEAIAKYAATLPNRVRGGEFTLRKSAAV